MISKIIKQFYLLQILLIWGSNCYAQNIAPQSVNSCGSMYTQANGSLTYTVGELVILTQFDNQGNSISSGFTSGSTITTLSIVEPDSSLLDVNVFPNPVMEQINIRVNYTNENHIHIKILDLKGKEVFNENYSGISNLIGINAKDFATGTYILSLSNKENKLLCSYKIVKI
jgi:hypothetical protein